MKTVKPIRSEPGPRQQGIVIPMVVMSMAAVIGLAGIGIDVGYVAWNQKRLNAMVDAAALAGAQDLRKETWTVAESTALSYASKHQLNDGNWKGGGGAGDYNSLASNVKVYPPTIEPKLITNIAWLNPKASKYTSGNNTIRVTQTADVPLFFARWMSPVRINARATATVSGGGTPPLNVAMVIDTTGSMDSSDSQCGMTKIACALKGARSLATQLQAKGSWLSLLTFPPLSAQGVLDQKDCTKPNVSSSPCAPDVTRHMLPRPNSTQRWQDTSTYNTYSTIVTMIGPADYITNKILDGTKELGKALSVTSTCGLETPKCGVTNNTHIAQAIFQAQALLAAKKAEVDNDQDNVMIILSDGDTAASTMAPDTEFQAKISRDVSSNNSGNVLQVQTGTVTSWSLPLAVGKTITWGSNTATITAMSPTASCNGKACTGTGGAGTYALSNNFTVTSNTTMSTPVTGNPYYYNQCQHAIIAANMAKEAGTKVYVIGYNAESTSGTCSLDRSTNGGSSISSAYVTNGVNTTACKSLQWMAGDTLTKTYPGSSSPYFFSTNTGKSGGCTSVNDIAAVDDLFEDISADLSGARLVPDDVW